MEADVELLVPLEPDLPLAQPEPHARRVDGDRLIALDLKRIEQKGNLKRNVTPARSGFEFGNFPIGKVARIEQRARDERRLAVIDMSGENDG